MKWLIRRAPYISLDYLIVIWKRKEWLSKLPIMNLHARYKLILSHASNLFFTSQLLVTWVALPELHLLIVVYFTRSLWCSLFKAAWQFIYGLLIFSCIKVLWFFLKFDKVIINLKVFWIYWSLILILESVYQISWWKECAGQLCEFTCISTTPIPRSSECWEFQTP